MSYLQAGAARGGDGRHSNAMTLAYYPKAYPAHTCCLALADSLSPYYFAYNSSA